MQGGNCFITDLGLCGPVDEKSSDKVYGIVSYVAPEVLRGKKNTKESDIYSVGMLMWEIFAGHPPFDDEAHDYHLQLKICKGLRPPILPGMPGDYVQMMQRCWDVDPAKRPTSRELWDFSCNEFKTESPNESSSNIGGGGNNNNNSSSNNRDGNNSNSQQIHKSHPLAYHTSRILNDKFAKLNLSNDSLLNYEI